MPSNLVGKKLGFYTPEVQLGHFVCIVFVRESECTSVVVL